MIEHTLAKLKKDMKKKDIVFSILFAQFFEKNSDLQNALPNFNSSSSQFILQNSTKQQLIIKSVHNIILFAKFKKAIAVAVCIFLPISTIVFAISNIGNPNEFKINDGENSILKLSKQKIIENKIILTPKDSRQEHKVMTTIEKSFVGDWKLKTKSQKAPCEVGSILKINADGTFEIITTNYKENGKYEVKDNIFTFYFNDKSIYSLDFKYDEKNIFFTLKNNNEIIWQMQYTR